MMFLNSDQGGGSGGEGTQTSGQEGTESLLGKTGTSGKPTETTQSASNPWINDKGEFTEGWLDRLPDGNRGRR